MLLDRGAYLSHEGDLEGINMTLERIWLDWEQKRLQAPRGEAIGVDQAVATILGVVQNPVNSLNHHS
jgi:hypothetical protein